MQKFSVKELTFWQLLGNRAIIQFIGLGVVCVVSHVRRMCSRASYERTLQEDDFDWTDMILGPRGVRKRVVLQVSVCQCRGFFGETVSLGSEELCQACCMNINLATKGLVNLLVENCLENCWSNEVSKFFYEDGKKYRNF